MEVGVMVIKIAARETRTPGKVPTRKVQFEFPSPEAKEVYLVGEFNHWDTHANKMKKDKNGIWKTTLLLKPGRYEYRLFADGNWENATSCCGCVPNEFGTQNCVKIVD
jgi:1,4-alpha-glucan branching enzyme